MHWNFSQATKCACSRCMGRLAGNTMEWTEQRTTTRPHYPKQWKLPAFVQYTPLFKPVLIISFRSGIIQLNCFINFYGFYCTHFNFSYKVLEFNKRCTIVTHLITTTSLFRIIGANAVLKRSLKTTTTNIPFPIILKISKDGEKCIASCLWTKSGAKYELPFDDRWTSLIIAQFISLDKF